MTSSLQIGPRSKPITFTGQGWIKVTLPDRTVYRYRARIMKKINDREAKILTNEPILLNLMEDIRFTFGLSLNLFSVIRAKHCFSHPKKEDKVARIGGMGVGDSCNARK